MERTEIFVSEEKLRANIGEVKSRLREGTELIAVLKGNAYGHGIDTVMPVLVDEGIESFAVSDWEEGFLVKQCFLDLKFAELSEQGIEPLDESSLPRPNIIILNDVCKGDWPAVVSAGLIPSIGSLESARELSEAAVQRDETAVFHLKIETGMNRYGFRDDEEGVRQILEVLKLPKLELGGMFTHFARADEAKAAPAEKQLKRLLAMKERLEAEGVKVPFVHTSNSPAVLLHPELGMDGVRVGDALYGLCPVDESVWPVQNLQEILTWKSYVAHVHTVKAGETIGYGGSFKATHDMVVATIPVGFADGFSRELSNCGFAAIRGQKVPIVGKVCMSAFMVDVTALSEAAAAAETCPVRRGDEVELLGEHCTILEMADLLDRNVDEIVCGLKESISRTAVDWEER